MINTIIHDLLQAPTGENAIAALARYEKITEALEPNVAVYRSIKRMQPDAAAIIENFLKDSEFQLPDELVDFYLEHGGVDVGEGWGSLHLFGAAQLLASLNNAPEAPRHGLLDFIQSVWDGRPEFDEAFSVEQTKQLNCNYFVIGITHVNDDTHRYLYVDRAGRCGVLLFNQDYFDDEHLEEMLGMLDSSPARPGFNAAFAAEVQIVIDLLARKYFQTEKQRGIARRISCDD